MFWRLKGGAMIDCHRPSDLLIKILPTKKSLGHKDSTYGMHPIPYLNLANHLVEEQASNALAYYQNTYHFAESPRHILVRRNITYQSGALFN